MPSRTVIVKVQMPLYGALLALIYDQHHSIRVQVPLTYDLMELAGDRPKFYAHARVRGEMLELLGEAPEQCW